jgi:hypothetical protein
MIKHHIRIMILVHFKSEKVGKMKHLNNVACVKLMIGKENEKKMEAKTAEQRTARLKRGHERMRKKDQTRF